MRIFLCSFADARMAAAMARFRQEGVNMKAYDEIFVYDETLLDPSFTERFQHTFSQRGFGYWICKLQAIVQTMNKMNDGDILHYADIGCHLDKYAKKRLLEYIDLTAKSPTGRLGFQMHLPEQEWTKEDIFNHYEILANDPIRTSGQFGATSLFLRKSADNNAFIKSWFDLYYNHFELIDDSPSNLPNDPSFKENRHDQSILSILLKLHGCEVVDFTEMYNTTGKYPVIAQRDKGKSKKYYYAFLLPPALRGIILEHPVYYFSKLLIGRDNAIKIRDFFSGFKNKVSSKSTPR